MINYQVNKNAYALFRVEDQTVEVCPIFNKEGTYEGIHVTIYSRDKRNFRNHDVDRLGAIIANRDVTFSPETGYSFMVETNFDLCEFEISYINLNKGNSDTIMIKYDCRKK